METTSITSWHFECRPLITQQLPVSGWHDHPHAIRIFSMPHMTVMDAHTHTDTHKQACRSSLNQLQLQGSSASICRCLTASSSSWVFKTHCMCKVCQIILIILLLFPTFLCHLVLVLGTTLQILNLRKSFLRYEIQLFCVSIYLVLSLRL